MSCRTDWPVCALQTSGSGLPYFLAGTSARGLLEKLDRHEIRLPIDRQFHPDLGHLRWHHAEVFKGRV